MCLDEPVEGQSAARFQCEGRLRAEMTLHVTVAGLDVEQDPEEINKSFGNGEEGDEYSDPLVMACCTEATTPFCESIASRSCYFDLIQTSCQSLPARLHEKADEQTLPGPEGALDALADHIEGSQDACRAAFGYGEVEANQPGCVPGGGSTYNELLQGNQWAIPGSFSSGTTTIGNVVITVKLASVHGVHPTNLAEAQGCWSIEDNDLAPHFLEIFPAGPLIESS